MAAKTDPQLDVNSWLQEELQEQYRHAPASVPEEWKSLLDSPAGNGIAKGIQSDASIHRDPCRPDGPGRGTAATAWTGRRDCPQHERER